ncbi:hypothetical protein H0H92_002808, partial [Tricholoma furcatifolium]
MYPDNPPQSTGVKQIYALINQIEQGDIPWDSFSIRYNGKLLANGLIPPWMTEQHEVWFQDPLHVLEGQFGNPDFVQELNYAPKRDLLAKDEDAHGATFILIILGSDKTTVSVATGQNDFYPLYAAIEKLKIPTTLCTAPPDDLDEGDTIPRRHDHTARLISECSMKELWDDY